MKRIILYTFCSWWFCYVVLFFKLLLQNSCTEKRKYDTHFVRATKMTTILSWGLEYDEISCNFANGSIKILLGHVHNRSNRAIDVRLAYTISFFVCDVCQSSIFTVCNYFAIKYSKLFGLLFVIWTKCFNFILSQIVIALLSLSV